MPATEAHAMKNSATAGSAHGGSRSHDQPSTARTDETGRVRRTVQIEPEQHPRTLNQCRRCGLWHDATQGVPGAGAAGARVMMIGEQPGDKEDLAGKPFVGPAGRLLESALQEAGIERSAVFITNAVKHFKWEQRGKKRMHKTPAQREIAACHYWLERELKKVDPRVIVTLGATALKAVLADPKLGLKGVMGKVIEHGNRLVVPTFHPSYALRAPDEKTRRETYLSIVQALQRADTLTRS
jgi:uracil-DNA glycosylase family protein